VTCQPYSNPLQWLLSQQLTGLTLIYKLLSLYNIIRNQIEKVAKNPDIIQGFKLYVLGVIRSSHLQSVSMLQQHIVAIYRPF